MSSFLFQHVLSMSSALACWVLVSCPHHAHIAYIYIYIVYIDMYASCLAGTGCALSLG